MVPNQITIIGFYRFMLKLNLVDTYIPLIIPCIAAPAVVFFMKQYMESTLSIEMIEAARIDGAREFRIFNTIIMPIMKPAVATQAIFQFIAQWNNLLDVYKRQVFCLTHNYFNSNFFLRRIKWNHIAISNNTIYSKNLDTFLYASWILYLNVISYTTEITFCGKAG